MPMNQFLFDHQLAAMKIDRSGSTEVREEAIKALAGHTKRIAEWRERNGLSNRGWPGDGQARIKQGG